MFGHWNSPPGNGDSTKADRAQEVFGQRSQAQGGIVGDDAVQGQNDDPCFLQALKDHNQATPKLLFSMLNNPNSLSLSSLPPRPEA
ncbi:hypothetical protein DUI87_15603 [Hirundo rustica rustica]|uniref:Uncharacterized protein n=1 Tax=Hirundo rustica rustica TaxID=333673 RepID=A0A3M0JZ30_HIRRU|nr:hypothetical protein DUI87_15603 [Hirundo rustica rustica]